MNIHVFYGDLGFISIRCIRKEVKEQDRFPITELSH